MNFLQDLRHLRGTWATVRRAGFVLFLIAFLVLAFTYPILWFFLTVFVCIPLGFTFNRYQTILSRKAQLKELFDNATSLNKTGDLVALLLHQMNKGIEAGCASGSVCRPIAKKIEEVEEQLADEYKKGREDLGALLNLSHEFRALVGRWY